MIKIIFYQDVEICLVKGQRAQLAQMGRARPTTWACFQTASSSMKAELRERPIRLNGAIMLNFYT